MSNKVGRPNKVSGIVMENRGLIFRVEPNMIKKQQTLTKADLGKNLSRPGKLVALDFVATSRCEDGGVMTAINMRKATVQEYGKYLREGEYRYRNDSGATTRLYTVANDGRVHFNLPNLND